MDHPILLVIIATVAAMLSGGSMIFFGLQVRASDRRIEALEAELVKSGEAAPIDRCAEAGHSRKSDCRGYRLPALRPLG